MTGRIIDPGDARPGMRVAITRRYEGVVAGPLLYSATNWPRLPIRTGYGVRDVDVHDDADSAIPSTLTVEVLDNDLPDGWYLATVNNNRTAHYRHGGRWYTSTVGDMHSIPDSDITNPEWLIQGPRP